LLLCTDGVSDALHDTEMEALLFRPTTSERLSGVKEECALKSRDNFSAILIQMLQDEISPEPTKKVILPAEERKQEEIKDHKLGTYCKHCGTEMMAGAKFCPCCGKNILQPKAIKETLLEEDKYWDLGLIKVKKPASIQWKVPKIRWPFGIIVILVLLNGFLFYKMNHLSDKQGRDFTLTNYEEKNRQIQVLNNAMKNLKQENELLRKNVKVLTDSIIKLNGNEKLQ
jgi:cell division protein FtsB